MCMHICVDHEYGHVYIDLLVLPRRELNELRACNILVIDGVVTY